MKDNLWFDGTDFAHPAFRRGQDDGVRGAVMRLRRALDGKDEGHGTFGSPELELLRRDILAMRKERSAAMRTKQELIDEFLKEGDDGTFLEVFLDVRDLIERWVTQLEGVTVELVKARKAVECASQGVSRVAVGGEDASVGTTA